MNPEMVNQAIKSIKETQKSFKHQHNRVHLDTSEDNMHRLRALEIGICRSCDNLKIEFNHQDGYNRVSLGCKKGLSPLELYRNTPMGQKAKCSRVIVS